MAQQRTVGRDGEQRAHLDLLIGSALDDGGLDYDHVEEGAFLVPLRGEHRLTTMTWLVVGDSTLLVEAFFMRRPEENEGGTYGYLLARNARTYGVHFSIDRTGDVYLTGHVPLHAVTPEEIDRLLGAVLTYSDETFDPAVALGFAGAIEREKAWRARLGEDGTVGVARRPAGTPGAPPSLAAGPPLAG